MKDAFASMLPGGPRRAVSFRESLDLVLRSYLTLVYFGLGSFYALLTVSHLLLLQGTTRAIMASVAVVTMLLLVAAGWRSLRWQPPPSWAHPIGFLVGLLTHANSLIHLLVTADAAQTINVVLVVITAGCFLLSAFWLNLLLLVCGGSWVAVMSVISSGQPWGHYAYGILSAAIITNLVRFARVRTHREVWELYRERASRQRELIERAAREAAILESALDCIVVIDELGRVIEFNPAAERTFGYQRSEAIGLQMAELIVPPSLRQAHYDGIRRFRETGVGPVLNQRIEISAMRAGGDEFPVELAIVPIDAGGKSLFSAYLREITERKRTEAELAGARDRAEAASLAKSRFLATMSHEIRTPLNPVIGLTSVLLETRLDPEQRNYVKRIRQSGLLLLRRISDILDFSKIEAGHMEIEEIDFSLRDSVSQVIELFEQQAAAKGLSLSLSIDERVPVWVHADSGRLQQVLSNLVSNAIKFTDRGSVRADVGVVPGERTCVSFSVSDTGVGIPEQDRDRLFDAFRQVDSSSTRRFEGSGLGLSIARELVHLLGGEIDFESALGRGSRFYFSVPVRLAEAPLSETNAASAPPPHETPSVVGAHILVAEDNSINQEVITLMLRRLGHTVDLAGDGREALEASLRGRYDLILMDCQMPVMDGFTAASEIRRSQKVGSRVPIIAMTAYASVEDRDRCFAAGMDDFLSKPVDLERLRAVLAHWLSLGHGKNTPAVDVTVLAGLRELESPNHPALVERLVRNWIERTPERLARMQAARQAGELEAIAHEAHNLKSESGNLGAIAYSELASELQDCARNGDLERSASWIAALEQAYPEVRDAFDKDLAESADSSSGGGRAL